ncbi:MAG: IS21 family transposase [bacterium]|nr:IS21 family transposase [bacterium]
MAARGAAVDGEADSTVCCCRWRGRYPARTVRRYVAEQRSTATRKEAFVHRSMRPGTTMEVDFGESWVDVAGVPSKVKYLVATLPFSNAYFAKAYPVERLESLLDGIESAFCYYGGVVERVVLDNTSLAVKDVLAGRDRVLTEAFEAFRGGYPFRAEFCAPAKGWEKGSVETGVKYVRNLVFRPRLAVESWAALNAALLLELETDLPMRHLDDGRTVEQGLAQERQHLRALPVHRPATCRVVARVADKFGHVRVDHVTYSVPIRHAYRPVWVKLYHDRVALAVGAEVVAEHARAFVRGAKLHVLPLLERKHRAVAEATALDACGRVSGAGGLAAAGISKVAQTATPGDSGLSQNAPIERCQKPVRGARKRPYRAGRRCSVVGLRSPVSKPRSRPSGTKPPSRSATPPSTRIEPACRLGFHRLSPPRSSPRACSRLCSSRCSDPGSLRIPVKSITRSDAKPIADSDANRSPVGAKRRGLGSRLRVVAPR